MAKNWWKVLLIMVLTLALLYFFFQSVEWDKVWESLTDVNLPFFILAVLLVPSHLVTRSIRWKYLLRHEKENITFYNRFAATAIGFTVSLTFPGRIGEVVTRAYR
jgi:uncharacterized membrane protein YbhN (UPF0104 family)